MAELAKLDATFREESGKGAARQIRSEGRVPAVLYGMSRDPISLSVDAHAMGRVIAKVGGHAIIELEVDGVPGKDKSHTVMLKDIQSHPIKDSLTHIDFQKIDMNKVIDRVISLHLVGTAAGTRIGGVLQHGVHELTLRGIAKNIPESFDVDIEALEIGSAIRIADLEFPEGMEALSSPDEVVVSVVAPRLEEEEPEVAEGEEGEEMAEPEVIGAKDDEEEGEE